jgi:hypothetical protein
VEFPQSNHPFELLRRLELFWQNFLGDFEMRHPETRRRLGLELSLKLPETDKARFKNLTRRFQSARRIISFLDWPLLFEWNERRSQAEILIRISEALKLQAVSELEISQCIQNRIRSIQELIRQTELGDHPKFQAILRSRLSFGPLRDEANYLIDRLYELNGTRSNPEAA